MYILTEEILDDENVFNMGGSHLFDTRFSFSADGSDQCISAADKSPTDTELLRQNYTNVEVYLMNVLHKHF